VDYKDNYPDPTLKTLQQLQATSAFHQTVGFGFFKKNLSHLIQQSPPI